MEHRRILIVEDQQDIADLLTLHLTDMGAVITHCTNGNEGMSLALSKTWDLLILDIQLPGASGLDICRRVRKEQAYTPLLLLTSRSSELDRVLGLDLGADDYITKPFSVMELIARIKAIFRRASAMEKTEPQTSRLIKIGPLIIDEGQRQVTLGNRHIDLTAREFDLLKYFALHPGRVFSRSELLDQVWGYGHDGYEHTVNSHINRLRTKIEADSNDPKYIVTLWGVGYKLDTTELSA